MSMVFSTSQRLGSCSSAVLQFCTEVVISKLIERFVFEIPPDKTIRWNIGNVQWPTVEGEDTTSLPMVVSLVKRDGE